MKKITIIMFILLLLINNNLLIVNATSDEELAKQFEKVKYEVFDSEEKTIIIILKRYCKHLNNENKYVWDYKKQLIKIVNQNEEKPCLIKFGKYGEEFTYSKAGNKVFTYINDKWENSFGDFTYMEPRYGYDYYFKDYIENTIKNKQIYSNYDIKNGYVSTFSGSTNIEEGIAFHTSDKPPGPNSSETINKIFKNVIDSFKIFAVKILIYGVSLLVFTIVILYSIKFCKSISK